MAQLAAPPRFVPYSTMVDVRRKAEEEQARKKHEASDLELRLGLSVGNKTSSVNLSMSAVAEEAKQAQAKKRAKDREQKEKEVLFPTTTQESRGNGSNCAVPFPYSNMSYMPVNPYTWQHMIPYWGPAAAAAMACHGLMFPFFSPAKGAGVAEQAVSSSSHGSSTSVVSDDHQRSGSISNDSKPQRSKNKNNDDDNNKSKRKDKSSSTTPELPDLTLKLETSSASPETNDSSVLPAMPCVSTTGDGPHGKTITGVLYRYDNGSEVSIVCACHGSKLSPAEFVKHAGGTDVEHPLRQIVVVNS